MKFFYILVALTLSSCSAINKKIGLKDDNILEETFEYAIKMQTDLDIDLTPSSPE